MRTRLGGADAPVDAEALRRRTPTRSARTIERQFWQESSIRATYVREDAERFRAVLLHADRDGVASAT